MEKLKQLECWKNGTLKNGKNEKFGILEKWLTVVNHG